MKCEQIKEQLEAYALDALDIEERATVERHLASCPDCQGLVKELAEVAGLLPQALATASALQPPASLKQRLLQSLEAQRPSTSPVIEPDASYRSETFHNLSANQRLPEKPHKARPNYPIWPWLLWGRSRTVSILAVLILFALLIALGTRLTSVLAQEQALKTELTNLFGQQELVLEVVDSNQTIRRVLRSPHPENDSPLPSYGKLFTRSDLPHVVAMVARLPQPPAGQAYHLWLTRQGQTTLAGVMAVNEPGFGLLVFDADQNNPSYEAAQLTLQPMGSTTPSDNLILSWEASEP